MILENAFEDSYVGAYKLTDIIAHISLIRQLQNLCGQYLTTWTECADVYVRRGNWAKGVYCWQQDVKYNTMAMYKLGLCSLWGIGRSMDHAGGVVLLRMAAEQGHIEARSAYAITISSWDTPTLSNIKESMISTHWGPQYFCDPCSQLATLQIYDYDADMIPHFYNSQPYFLKIKSYLVDTVSQLARDGNLIAQWTIARRIDRTGVDINFAIEMLTLAASNGHTYARQILGCKYELEKLLGVTPTKWGLNLKVPNCEHQWCVN